VLRLVVSDLISTRIRSRRHARQNSTAGAQEVNADPGSGNNVPEAAKHIRGAAHVKKLRNDTVLAFGPNHGIEADSMVRTIEKF
jgi:hypothetical protein